MANTDVVYTLPQAENVDGLNLPINEFRLLFKKKIDDYRLKAGDDTLIATYPRTGTSWLCQVVSLLLASNEKYEEVKKIPVYSRALYLERNVVDEEFSQLDLLDTVPTPRAVKTHLPYRFIRRWIVDDQLKTIITTRNPKDTLVSLFHFYQGYTVYDFNGSWDDFFKHVQAGKVLYGDQYEWYKDWDDKIEKGQLMFIKYEDMKQDLLLQIKRITSFLQIQVSDKHVQQVIQDSGINEMKAALNKRKWFKPGTTVRSGQSGGWKKYFTVEQNEWFDSKYKKLYEDLSIDVHYE